jgi:hypothetical protein
MDKESKDKEIETYVKGMQKSGSSPCYIPTDYMVKVLEQNKIMREAIENYLDWKGVPCPACEDSIDTPCTCIDLQEAINGLRETLEKCK